MIQQQKNMPFNWVSNRIKPVSSSSVHFGDWLGRGKLQGPVTSAATKQLKESHIC